MGASCALAASALLAGCMPDDSVNAPIVPCTLAAEFRVELGRLEDPASVRDLWDHMHVIRTQDGRWIVASEVTPAPLVYAPDGAYEGTLGRTGEGPGEFHRPRGIAIDHTDSVWVSDSRGVLVLDPSGRHARTLTSPGYAIEGFTPSNEPYSVLVRVPESDEHTYHYVMIRSRDLEPRRGFGPGLDDPGADGRTVRTINTGTIFVADSIVLTNETWDREQSWIDRWTPGGHEVWLPRRDVWRALGQDGDPPSWHDQSFLHVSLASDGEGGYWSVAVVPRSTSTPEEGSSWWNLAPDDRIRAFASYLLHLTDEGEITGIMEIPEAHPHFVDHEHLVSPWVHRDTGLMTLRVWQIRRDCGLDRSW